MRKRILLMLALTLCPVLTPAQDAKTALSHDVFFSLNDASPAARDALVAACKKYLTGHEGVVAFSAGVLAAELNRDVNDRDFDVALHMVFDGKASHDKYQDAPRHKQFIEENQKNWKKVRVFDSLVDVVK
jgi:Stress responsive A/B Barrel Domain